MATLPAFDPRLPPSASGGEYAHGKPVNSIRSLFGVIVASTILVCDNVSAQSFPVGDAALRFEDSGSGPPVVLVPGWTQTLETWDFQVPALAEAFRVLRYDRGPWGAQTDPVDLSALLDHLRLDRVALVGHSLGAAAALRFAAAYPERVAALVVFGPPGAPGVGAWSGDDTWEAHLARLGVEPPNPYVIVERHGVDSLLALARSHPVFRLPDTGPRARELLDRIWGRYDGSDLQATDHTPVTQPVTEEALRALRVPTLVVVGDQELAHFRRSAERLRELIPDAELAVVPGGGHMVHMVEPEKFVSTIEPFLARHLRGTVTPTQPELIDRAGVVVLEGATLIDGTGSAPVASSAVVIEGERVVRVGAVGDFRYGDDVEVHDVTGRWILPGLIEMHAHLPAQPAEQERVLRAYLAHGVTTLANLAAGPATGLDPRARLASGLVEGPRIFTAGRALNGPSWMDGFPFIVRVESEREVREEVRRQASSAVDLVKVYAHLPPDLVCAAVDEAHGAGLRAVGHLGETSWTRALKCGIDILVHSALAGPTWELLDEPDRERFRRNVFPPRNGLDAYDPLLWIEWAERVDLDGPHFQELLALLDRPGVAVDPNLVVFESIAWSDDPALRRRAEFLAPMDAEAAGAAPHPATASWTTAGFESVRSAWPVFLEMIRRFHEAGVRLTAGSDFGNAWLTPGAALHRELELLASAGIPPLEVLTAATRNAAEALGASGEIGVLAPGALADLVVLDRDPLADVANVRSVVAVFQGGRQVEPR